MFHPERQFDLRGRVLQWFRSYLSDRTFPIVYEARGFYFGVGPYDRVTVPNKQCIPLCRLATGVTQCSPLFSL